MLVDKEMAKVAKAGAKNGKLFFYRHEEELFFSDTYGIYKINPFIHKKTLQELSKIFLGLPEEGKGKNLDINKEVQETEKIKFLIDIFTENKNKTFEHELKSTNFLQEATFGEEKPMLARVLINQKFATMINEKFFKVIDKSCSLKCDGRNSGVCVFDHYDELLAFILPIKVQAEKEEKFDLFIKIAA